MAPRGLIVIFLFFFVFFCYCARGLPGVLYLKKGRMKRERERERGMYLFILFYFVFRGRYTPKHILYIPGLNHIKEREEEKKKTSFSKRCFVVCA